MARRSLQIHIGMLQRSLLGHQRVYGVGARMSSSYQPPTPPNASNPHRDFYKTFSRPFAKVFLGAMLTYQITYWTWLKLESMEIKQNKNDEIRTLEEKLKEVTGSRQTKP